MRPILSLAIVVLLLMSCSGDDSPSDFNSNLHLPKNLINGADLDNIESHWSSVGTTGSYLHISFLDDGSALLHFGNTNFYGEPLARQLIEGSWEEQSRGRIQLTVYPPDQSAFVMMLTDIRTGDDAETITLMAEDERGEFVPLTMVFGTGQPPCC